MKLNETTNLLEAKDGGLGKPKEIYYNDGTAMYIIIWDKAFAVINARGTINKISKDMKAVAKKKKINAFDDMEKIGGLAKLPANIKRLAQEHIDNFEV